MRRLQHRDYHVAHHGAAGPAADVSCGRILVIDDESLVIRAIRRQFGGTVEVVGLDDARRALRLLCDGGRFGAILCDLMMPGLSGPEFYRELHHRMPEEIAKVVFLTGGVVSSAMRDFLRRCPNSVVDKPYEPDELAQIVSTLLGSPVVGAARAPAGVEDAAPR